MYAVAAYWAFHRDEDARAFELVDRGLQLVGSVDDPRAALCLSMSPWRTDDDLGDARLEHLLRMAPTLDLDRDWWVLITLADQAIDESTPHMDYVARLVEIADRVRAPMLLVEADLARSRRLLEGRPPDLEGTLLLARRALETARRAGDLVAEGESLRTIAIAVTAMGRGDELDACHEAVAHLYPIRYWFRLWHAMESASLALASNRQLQAAATIVGHLEAHHPPYGVERWLDFRARTLQTIRSTANAEAEVAVWMAQGAAADRNHIVHLALAALKPVPNTDSLQRATGSDRPPTPIHGRPYERRMSSSDFQNAQRGSE
jgi:hypothetical protein